jgi:hypothetical protein
VNAHHDDEAQKTKNGEMPPYLACQMSKWFYDTSTGAATGAVPLWFFCWRGTDRSGSWLSGNTVFTEIYVVRAARA